MTKVFLFSDLHCSNKNLEKARDFIIDKNNEIKGLVFAGDVVNMGEPVWFMEKFIKVVDQAGLPLLWSPGNNDFGRAYHKLNSRYKSLEGRVVELVLPLAKGKLDGVKKDGIPNPASQASGHVREDKLSAYRFTGVGGSPASWAGQYEGESMIDKKKVSGTIFVSHYPPPISLNLSKYDYKNQNTNFNLKNSLKIENCKIVNSAGKRLVDAPLAHVCGHLHYRFGVAYLGQTKVIQLASLETGHYAIMDLDNLAVEFGRF